jgi:hypothetical protein
LKVGINLQNNIGVPISSFVNKDELSSIISSLKIIAQEALKHDQTYFNQIKDTYLKLYEKFSKVGLLDNENGLSECFYINEIGNNTEISKLYLENNPDGVFYDLESEIDKQRFDLLISANIKKFDEKTIKFYSEPYLDIRLDKSVNLDDYQLQIVFDPSQISYQQVALDFGQDPSSIKEWQVKNLDEGQSISFSHDLTAKYLGIARGDELNQTLLAIRDQARNEQEQQGGNQINNNQQISNDHIELQDYQLGSQEINNDVLNNDNKNNKSKFGDDFSAYEAVDSQQNLINTNFQDSLNITLPQEVAQKFQGNDFESQFDFKNKQDGVFQIYQAYEDNYEVINSAIQNPVLQKVLNFLIANPDLKMETTSNPTSKEIKHQLKLVFLKGFNEKTQMILAKILTNSECKPWQLSQTDESRARGYDGSFIIPHDFSARMIGVRNPNEVNNAIEEVFNLTSNLEILNMTIIEYLRNDSSFNVLKFLIANNFSIAFEYKEINNIFSKKDLVLVAQNDEERENIYNFLGYSWEQNQNISREELLDQRALITDVNGDIILKNEICASLFGVHRESDIDLVIRKIESFLQANKQLCDIFNADEHQNLVALLELDQVENIQDNEDFSDDEDTSQLKEIYV